MWSTHASRRILSVLSNSIDRRIDRLPRPTTAVVEKQQPANSGERQIYNTAMSQVIAMARTITRFATDLSDPAPNIESEQSTLADDFGVWWLYHRLHSH